MRQIGEFSLMSGQGPVPSPSVVAASMSSVHTALMSSLNAPMSTVTGGADVNLKFPYFWCTKTLKTHIFSTNLPKTSKYP